MTNHQYVLVSLPAIGWYEHVEKMVTLSNECVLYGTAAVDLYWQGIGELLPDGHRPPEVLTHGSAPHMPIKHILYVRRASAVRTDSSPYCLKPCPPA